MVGGVLTAHTTAWLPAATSYSYTWYVAGDPEGTGTTFTPWDDQEVGLTVTVVIEATSDTAGPTSSPPSLPTAPITAGQVTAGQVAISPTLSNDWACASLTGWAQTNWGMVYEWYLNGALVQNTPSSCYRLPQDSEGETLLLTAGQSFPDSPPVLANSPDYTVGLGNYGTATLGIQMNGDVNVGGTVSVDETNWSPTATAFAVQWYAYLVNGPILVGSGPTFTIPPKLVGYNLYARVVGTGPLMNSGLQYTDALEIAPGILSDVAPPVISGPPLVGDKLTASHGSWTPAAGTIYYYQWFSATGPSATPSAIPGATSATFVLPRALAGDLVSVRVSASKTAYSTTTTFSGDTVAIALPRSLRQRPALQLEPGRPFV
jgi:hypothetical protein